MSLVNVYNYTIYNTYNRSSRFELLKKPFPKLILFLKSVEGRVAYTFAYELAVLLAEGASGLREDQIGDLGDAAEVQTQSAVNIAAQAQQCLAQDRNLLRSGGHCRHGRRDSARNAIGGPPGRRTSCYITTLTKDSNDHRRSNNNNEKGTTQKSKRNNNSNNNRLYVEEKTTTTTTTKER